MFHKVLISDDLGIINQGVSTILKNLNIENVSKVQYCDEAYLKIKKAKLDNQPFDLLITDLSFIGDHREQKLKSGEDLITLVRKKHPELNVIAYSVDDRLQQVRRLVALGINAYVCKGRNGVSELSQAVQSVYEGKQYFSPKIAKALDNKSNLEIDIFDVELLRNISIGKSQEEISAIFKEKGASASSLSSIEKRLNKLKIQLNSKNTIHLIAIAKDLGLI
ncbi:response regulator transcription factor [Algibacter sp. L3A6]|uniref:response regulator transcription factor n=1 Tax=Algibacter sp. L3A6 TaxID=2686366 RepID=UPI00131D408B|nr:response regulator [Algibacter sp. L3A6]